MAHVVVPVAVTDVWPACQALPFHHWLLLERWMLTRTLATPDPVSVAVPQMRDVPAEQPPADQVVALYRPPSAGKLIALVGTEVSIRIWVPAVLTVSVFPAASTEK